MIPTKSTDVCLDLNSGIFPKSIDLHKLEHI
jgi:hypothetical protein